MPIQDPSRRLMNEYRAIALDLGVRFADIEAAMKRVPALFDKAKIAAVKDFAKEALLQRGGASFSQTTGANPQQVADDLATSLSRIDNLTNKLRFGRFARDNLLQCGLAIRAASVNE